MRIVRVETLLSRGPYPKSRHWKRTRKTIHEAASRCCWPPGSGSFTIYSESGKNRGERNGVLPIKREFVEHLRDKGWAIEGKAKSAMGRCVRHFDAVIAGPDGPIVVEWKTGNISSSHLSMNKMSLLLSSGLIAAGTMVVPSRELYKHLADRAGSIPELEPYFPIWNSIPCENGLLEILVIEHDRTSYDVPKIPRLISGRARGWPST
ncbi:MAG: hypothetical protein ABSE56_04345 [Bryobacteraceae bacterium]|jgi:hypothetical protein